MRLLWLTALGIAAAVATAQPVASLAALKGQRLPDFVLRDLDGKTHSFARWRGQVVVLNFWSPG